MRKISACLLVFSLSLIGCTTVTTIGGVRGNHYPTPREGEELGIRIKSGSGVDKEVISIDQDMASPVLAGPEPSFTVEWTKYEIIAIVLIISSIVRDAINSILLPY
ncbi:MAG: hypothetical protein WA915_05420 [Candidatus Aminicenantaceae bacterium]